MSFSRIAFRFLWTSGQRRFAMVSAWSNSATSTPRRAKACAISRPMAPDPTTARLLGSDRRLKIFSLVSARLPSAAKTSGMTGREPVAITIARASTVRSSSSSSLPGPANLASPFIRTAAGISLKLLRVSFTNRSRSALILSKTAAPSTVTPSTAMPNVAARSTLWRALAAAISSLDGMHPFTAQVVPLKAGSISKVLAPLARAARSAARPAVPAPITATSHCSVLRALMRQEWPWRSRTP